MWRPVSLFVQRRFESCIMGIPHSCTAFMILILCLYILDNNFQSCDCFSIIGSWCICQSEWKRKKEEESENLFHNEKCKKIIILRRICFSRTAWITLPLWLHLDYFRAPRRVRSPCRALHLFWSVRLLPLVWFYQKFQQDISMQKVFFYTSLHHSMVPNQAFEIFVMVKLTKFLQDSLFLCLFARHIFVLFSPKSVKQLYYQQFCYLLFATWWRIYNLIKVCQYFYLNKMLKNICISIKLQ